MSSSEENYHSADEPTRSNLKHSRRHSADQNHGRRRRKRRVRMQGPTPEKKPKSNKHHHSKAKRTVIPDTEESSPVLDKTSSSGGDDILHKKTYRALYIIGMITAVIAIAFIAVGFSHQAATCKFGSVDLTDDVMESIFQGGEGGEIVNRNETVALELVFGVWKYCANGECATVRNQKQDAKVGELNKEFLKMGQVQAAQSMFLISEFILVGIITYLIIATVKMMTLKTPLLVLNSCYLFFLLVGCSLFTDWLLKNIRMYEGYCELGVPFMMPWLGLVVSLYGLLSINLNMFFLKFADS